MKEFQYKDETELQYSGETELQPGGEAYPLPWSARAFLSLLIIFMLIFVGQFVNALIQVNSPIVQKALTLHSPLQGRRGSPLKPFDLPAHRTMLYVQQDKIYSVTTKVQQNQDQVRRHRWPYAATSGRFGSRWASQDGSGSAPSHTGT